MTRTLLLTFALLLSLPALAHAGGHAEIQGDTLVVTGTEGVDKIAVAPFPTRNEYSIENVGLDPSTGPATAGPGCVYEDRQREAGRAAIWCQAAPVKKVALASGGGDDEVIFLIPSGSPITRTADTGAGDDRLIDNYGGGVYRLGDGDDEGWATGTATFDAGAGDDSLQCRDSNRETRLKGVFTLNGGIGEDRICGGVKADRIDGGAADDKIFAGEGDDRIEGGSGDDQIEGGDDDDRIDAGRGEDEVEGGSGKDTIRAKDRAEDDISCGSKRDTVFIDRIDLLSRCETIRR